MEAKETEAEKDHQNKRNIMWPFKKYQNKSTRIKRNFLTPDQIIITRFFLEIGGVRTKVSTKELAIKIGVTLYKIDKTIKLIEERTIGEIWRYGTKYIEKQEFDKSILLKL